MYFDLPKKQMIAEAERRADEMAMNRNVESTKTDRPLRGKREVSVSAFDVHITHRKVRAGMRPREMNMYENTFRENILASVAN